MSGAIPLLLLYVLMSWAGTASLRDPSKADCYLTSHILILEIKVVFNMYAYCICPCGNYESVWGMEV